VSNTTTSSVASMRDILTSLNLNPNRPPPLLLSLSLCVERLAKGRVGKITIKIKIK